MAGEIILETDANIEPLVTFLGDATKQIKFASAKALTVTARMGREAVFDRMRKKFTLRNKFMIRPLKGRARGPGGIGSTVAIAKDKEPKSEVFIGEGAEFMTLHETGGIRTRKGGGRLAVPLSGTRKDRKQVIRKSKRPKNVLRKKRHFIVRTKDGTEFVVRKKKAKRRKMSLRRRRKRALERKKGFTNVAVKETRGLKFLYVFERNRPIQSLLGFEDTIGKVIKDRWPENWLKEIRRAIATAK